MSGSYNQEFIFHSLTTDFLQYFLGYTCYIMNDVIIINIDFCAAVADRGDSNQEYSCCDGNYCSEIIAVVVSNFCGSDDGGVYLVSFVAISDLFCPRTWNYCYYGGGGSESGNENDDGDCSICYCCYGYSKKKRRSGDVYWCCQHSWELKIAIFATEI